MNNYLLFCNNENWEQVYFNTKSDIINNGFFKKKLESFYGKRNHIRCACNEKNHIYMNIRKNKKKDGTFFFSLGTNPNYANLHSNDCPFFNNSDEYYDEENNIFNSIILDEVKTNKTSSSPTDINKIDEVNKKRRFTFRHFCKDILANAYKYSFNSINLKNDRRNFCTPTFSDFYKKIYKILLDTDIRNKRKMETIISNIKSKGYNLKYGILNNNLNELLTNINSKKNNELINLGLNSFTKDFDQYYYNFNITKKHLVDAAQICKIFNNYISGPYFVFMITKNKIAHRFYLLPVYVDLIKDSFCFVDSDREREYAEYLTKNSISFLKPFGNDEFKYIKREKIILNNSTAAKPRFYTRPDFLEFDNDKIKIVEVLGFMDNKEYVDHLSKKREEYEKLCKIYNFLEYKEV